MPPATRAVLLMAYGTPERPEQVGPYFTHIRGGRTPSPEAIAHLRARYERVGGGTPLRRITEQVRERLESALAAAGDPRAVYVGMKHWHPFIADTLRRMRDDRVVDVTAIALAPHYSRMSVGAYERAIRDAERELGAPFGTRVVQRWHTRPEFVAMTARLVEDGLAAFPAAERDAVTVVFSAHSLPQRIRDWGDPYEAELLASSAAVAQHLSLRDWRFAWQSAGGTSEPWLGPDILAYLETLASEGVRRVLQVPIGFVAEHLEILFDIDIEAVTRARELGITLRRTALPNASPALVETLLAVVAAADAEVAAEP
ncbi:MAG TPA: ferrochelatase [Gemmatimonadaceae bacterium]|nr:ferrochelatase [Gemmatimonadaceae bacterium]